MSVNQAIAEDFRRIGVALIIAGFIGVFLQERVPVAAALIAIVVGVAANIFGYWRHSQES